MSDTPFNARNGLVANILFTANSTLVALGANVLLTPSSVTVLSTGANVVINSSTVFIGNSTVNTTINSSSLSTIGVNTAAQYTWSNVHIFTSTIEFTGYFYASGTVDITNANILNQVLTDGATINWNCALGQIATITLGGNRTMAAPSTLRVGTYILHIIQDGTGSRTITWNSVFKWVQGTAPVLSTTAGRHDVISFICDGTNLYGSFLPDVR